MARTANAGSADHANSRPQGIHILDAEGRVLRTDLRTRKAGRQWARKLSRNGSRVYLVDPGFDPPVTPYVEGSQADNSPIESIPSDWLAAYAASSVTDEPSASDDTPVVTAFADPDEPAGALPELLRPGLDLVIVGVNPGVESARQGRYYSDHNNRFWRMLSESGLVDDEVGPSDDRDLPDRFGIGLTDVVRTRVESHSAEVCDTELHAARPDFERRIADAAPRIVCFNGKTKPFDVLFPGARVPGGRQQVRVANTDAEVWVMPSTSGSASGYHDETRRVLRELAHALGRSTTR